MQRNKTSDEHTERGLIEVRREGAFIRVYLTAGSGPLDGLPITFLEMTDETALTIAADLQNCALGAS